MYVQHHHSFIEKKITMTDVKEIGEASEPETNESRLSIVSNQGLTATTTSDSNHSSNQDGILSAMRER